MRSYAVIADNKKHRDSSELIVTHLENHTFSWFTQLRIVVRSASTIDCLT